MVLDFSAVTQAWDTAKSKPEVLILVHYFKSDCQHTLFSIIQSAKTILAGRSLTEDQEMLIWKTAKKNKTVKGKEILDFFFSLPIDLV